MEEIKTTEVGEEPTAEPASPKKRSKKQEEIDSLTARNAELEARVAELEGELKEQSEKHLRMAAEYDNFRRRSREEREAAYGGAMGDTILELLPKEILSLSFCRLSTTWREPAALRMARRSRRGFA